MYTVYILFIYCIYTVYIYMHILYIYIYIYILYIYIYIYTLYSTEKRGPDLENYPYINPYWVYERFVRRGALDVQGFGGGGGGGEAFGYFGGLGFGV